MPKYGVHSIIMDEAAENSTEEIKTLLKTYRGAALLGSVGPDLLFFPRNTRPLIFSCRWARTCLK